MANPVETLAAWLTFSNASGENGPLIPTRDQIRKIVDQQPGRYAEAYALSEKFVNELLLSEPETLTDTGQAAMRFLRGVDKIQKKLGGFMSAAPVGPKK